LRHVKLDELAKQSEVQSHERLECKYGGYVERKIVPLPGEISLISHMATHAVMYD